MTSNTSFVCFVQHLNSQLQWHLAITDIVILICLHCRLWRNPTNIEESVSYPHKQTTEPSTSCGENWTSLFLFCRLVTLYNFEHQLIFANKSTLKTSSSDKNCRMWKYKCSLASIPGDICNTISLEEQHYFTWPHFQQSTKNTALWYISRKHSAWLKQYFQNWMKV